MVPPRSLRNIKRTKRYVTATVTRELGGTLGALEYASETKRAAYIGYLAGERSNAGRALVRVGLGGVHVLSSVCVAAARCRSPRPRPPAAAPRGPRTARSRAGPGVRSAAGTRAPGHPAPPDPAFPGTAGLLSAVSSLVKRLNVFRMPCPAAEAGTQQ